MSIFRKIALLVLLALLPTVASAQVCLDTPTPCILYGSAAPTASATEGELYLQTGVGGALWRKTGTGTSGWIKVLTTDNLSGTAGKIAKFLDANTVSDSIITETGTVIRVVGGSLVVDTTSQAANLIGTTSVRTPLIDTASGPLTLAPATVISVGSAAAGKPVQTSDFASGIGGTGWQGLPIGYWEMQRLFTKSLVALIFEADLAQVFASKIFIPKSFGILSTAFTCPAFSGTSTLTVRDFPSALNMQVYESGDAIRVMTFDRSGGGLTIGDCVGVVTSYVNNAGDTQSWTFTRYADAGGVPFTADGGSLAASTVILAENVAMDFGVAGSQFALIDSWDGAYNVNGSYFRTAHWIGSPTDGNFVIDCQIGNLFGLTATVNESGLLCGTWATRTTTPVIRASTAGVQLYGTELNIYNATVPVIRLNPANQSLALGPVATGVPTAFGTGVGFWASPTDWRVGDPTGNRISYDDELKLVSNFLTIDDDGITLPAATGFPATGGRSFNLGTFASVSAWSSGLTRGLWLGSAGTGTEVGTIRLDAQGALGTATLSLEGFPAVANTIARLSATTIELTAATGVTVSHSIVFVGATPASTTNRLYSPNGADLYFHGNLLATTGVGGSISGGPLTVSRSLRATAAQIIGDGCFTDTGSALATSCGTTINATLNTTGVVDMDNLTDGTAETTSAVVITAAGRLYYKAQATGTVTGLTAPAAVFDVAGPTAGILALTFDTQAANTVFRGPTSGGATVPSFGVLVAADIPAAAVVNMAGDIGGTSAASVIQPGVIVNADVNASAAITYTKLALGGSIINTDISNVAAITYTKLLFADNIVAGDIASGAVGASELAATSVSANTYGSAQGFAQFIVDADGRLTFATTLTPQLTLLSTYFASLDAAQLLNINASQLLFGTMPDARFESTVDLVNLNVSVVTRLGSGTLAGAAPAGSTFSARENTSGGSANLVGAVVNHFVGTTAGSAQALEGYVYLEHASGTVTQALGVIGHVEAAGAGATGFAKSFTGSLITNTGAGQVTKYCTYCSDGVARIGTAIVIPDAYHLYAGGFSATAGIMNRWGVYMAGADDANYFAGETRIGDPADLGAFPLQVTGAAIVTVSLTIPTITATANMTLNPVGDLITDPTGNDLEPATNYDINVGSITKKYLTAHIAELRVETLVAQDWIATIGGHVAVAPTTVHTVDFAAGATSAKTKHNQMFTGDIVFSMADLKFEAMEITGPPVTDGAGAWDYPVTRNLDGTGANQWYAGDALLNTGTAGSGFIDMYSLEAATSVPVQFVYNYDQDTTTYFDHAGESYWQPFGNGAYDGVDSAIYFGVIGTTWSNLFFYLTTAAQYNATLTWEYFNGVSWSAFTPDVVTDFKSTGNKSVEWSAANVPGWSINSVNTVSAYWVRVRISAWTSWAVIPVQGGRRVYRDKRRWGPTIAWMIRNSATWNDIYEQTVAGNLSGYYGFSTDTYGFATGRFANGHPFFTLEPTNGFRINRCTLGTPCTAFDTLGQWDTSGNLTIGKTSTEHVAITATTVQIKDGATVLTEIGAGIVKVGAFVTTGAVWLDPTSGNGVLLIDSSGATRAQVTMAGVATVGATATEHVNITSTSVQIKDGATVYTDLTAGALRLGEIGAGKANTYIDAGALALRLNTCDRVALSAAGILTINNSSCNPVFSFDASVGAEFTLPLTLATTGGIYQGTGTFASPTTGLKLWNSGGFGRLSGYNAGTLQAELGTDGKIKAAAGNVILDANGVSLVIGASPTSWIQWINGTYSYSSITSSGDNSAVTALMLVHRNTDGVASVVLQANNLTGADQSAYLTVTADDPGTVAYVEVGGQLRITGDSDSTTYLTTNGGAILVGAATIAGVISQTISASGGAGAVLGNTHSAGYGVKIKGGSDATRYALTVNSADDNTTFAQILGDGAAWFVGNVSALSYTDSTPWFVGDALAAIAGIRGNSTSGVDHRTLPVFAQATIRRLVESPLGARGIAAPVHVDEPGRNLGNMISMLTVATQQLNVRGKTQADEIAELRAEVAALRLLVVLPSRQIMFMAALSRIGG